MQHRDLDKTLLSIDSDNDNFIKLNWNFKGNKIKSHTNYHIFLILGHEIDIISKFMDEYYAKMTFGDVVGIFQLSKKSSKGYKIEWNQKTKFELEFGPLLKKNRRSMTDLDDSFEKLFLELRNKKKGLCFINIISLRGNELCIQKLQKCIHQKRKSGKIPDTAILSYFNEETITPIIHANYGLNILPFHRENAMKSCLFFSQYRKSITLASIKIRLEFESKECLKYKTTQWEATDFKMLEKNYYGVPSINFTETLFFVCLKECEIFKTIATMSLIMTHCNGQKWKSDERFSVELDLKKLLSQTLMSVSNLDHMSEIFNFEMAYTNYGNKEFYIQVEKNQR